MRNRATEEQKAYPAATSLLGPGRQGRGWGVGGVGVLSIVMSGSLPRAYLELVSSESTIKIAFPEGRKETGMSLPPKMGLKKILDLHCPPAIGGC